nr:carcinoembryonic antigen-related cell adhesion molecule 5 [Crassostrea gigas]
MVKLPLLKVLFIIKCGLLSFVHSQNVQISTRFMSGNVIFTWTPSNYSSYDISLTRDTAADAWTRMRYAQYTVRDVLLYDTITINVRATPWSVDNRLTFNVFKVKTKVGDTVNLSWTAPFFPVAGRYLVYHTYRENRTIFSVRSSGVSYGGYNQSTKYTYLTRPFASTNIMFKIRNITLDDAGYYNGGSWAGSAWSGGGVVLIVSDKPSKPKITGDLNVEVNRYITLTCSSQSTSAPDYYSKLLTLSYTWFVNDTRIGGENRKTLRYVTRDLKYNRYTCTATEEDLETDRSDPVQINPLYGPDIIKFTPEPILNINDKLTVREGETIGPFVCTADCNPPCNIRWIVKDTDGFSDSRSELGTLLQQATQRDMQLFRCIADRGNKTLKQSIQLDVQYLDDTLLYTNGEMKSNIELDENAPLGISCRVDGNPAPTIRLSRGQADTELEQGQGTWLNYTIVTAQCTDTDTYRCRGTSTGFSNTEKVININVLCNTRFDKAGTFKSTYGSKSGTDTTINVAVPIIANPPPQSSDFKWDGPMQVSARTILSTGDVSYKHVIESFIPVKDHTYFGYYTLSYKGQTVTRITINAEGEVASRSSIIAISLLSILLGLTWFTVAVFVSYNRRYRNVHQNSKHGEERTQIETQNMTQHYDDVQGTDVYELEAQNMTQHYDDVQGTVDEGNYTDLKEGKTFAEGDYTELGQRDPETSYQELKE